MRVIGYVRVSTDAQAEAGVSLKAQEAKLRAYADLYDLDLVTVITDPGASAKTLRRDGLQRALADLEAGHADGLLVAKLDRLTRSVKDLSTLIEVYFNERFSLFSVSEQIDTRSAGGRLVLNVLASVSQWEREKVGERTREALQHLKANGVKLGRAGHGWEHSEEVDADGRRVLRRVPQQAAAVERIRELRAEGRSLRDIARVLTRERFETQRGGTWTHKQVGTILRRIAKAA
jgi:DNA invertase Pin-like site-specific DNA recombinase